MSGKRTMAKCEGCGARGSHSVCSKCGNIWHCNKKPGRKGVSTNVCEKCGKKR